MTQSGAMMSSRRVASRSWNARLKRSMTSSVVLVMIAVPSWLGLMSDLAPFRGHGVPEAGSRSVLASVRPDHRTELIGWTRMGVLIVFSTFAGPVGTTNDAGEAVLCPVEMEGPA